MVTIMIITTTTTSATNSSSNSVGVADGSVDSAFFTQFKVNGRAPSGLCSPFPPVLQWFLHLLPTYLLNHHFLCKFYAEGGGGGKKSASFPPLFHFTCLVLCNGRFTQYAQWKLFALHCWSMPIVHSVVIIYISCILCIHAILSMHSRCGYAVMIAVAQKHAHIHNTQFLPIQSKSHCLHPWIPFIITRNCKL